ncbi:MAG: redoxin domain-containing protein [Phycisphaerales bacterium]|nr:redoxin domain-containing protein [Phycisphaerales bacterium]
MGPAIFERPHRGSWCLMLIATLLLGCGDATPFPAERSVVDLGGRPVDPLASTPRATVLVFTTPACPIANRYAPEITRLHERFASDGVRFWLVYADPADDAAAVATHHAAYEFPFAAVRDPEHVLVERTGATVTPEVAVFDPHGRMLYRGRIDDRFVAFGRTRPTPTERDLENVLDAIVHDRPITARTTEAIGCFIP